MKHCRIFAASNKTEHIMIDIRERVKALCEQRGITQTELARKMGVSRIALATALNPKRFLGKDENGEKKYAPSYPAISTLVKIADALNIDVEDIFMMGEVKEKSSTLRCPCCGAELKLVKL